MKEKAKDLRKKGLPIKQISKQLNKSPSTIYTWVKDIKLSDFQKKYNKSRSASSANKTKSIKIKKAMEEITGGKRETTKVEKGYNPKAVGDKSEARIIADFLDADMTILIPFGDKERYDLVVDECGDFIRVQCKTGRIAKSSFTFKTSSINWNTKVCTSYKGHCDVFAVYIRETKKVYIFNVNKSPESTCTVRLVPGRGNRCNRHADDHIFIPGKSLKDYS